MVPVAAMRPAFAFPEAMGVGGDDFGRRLSLVVDPRCKPADFNRSGKGTGYIKHNVSIIARKGKSETRKPFLKRRAVDLEPAGLSAASHGNSVVSVWQALATVFEHRATLKD
jgi:hypothetical protein